ncbi:MAG: hypothetical protein HYV07_00325 [Deltaproteobacteria bacterium]|nr:hypothetical protein [Deltaproteobacteria bacterium]
MRFAALLLAAALAPLSALLVAAALPEGTAFLVRFVLGLLPGAFIALTAHRNARDVAEREGGDGGLAAAFVVLIGHGAITGVVLTFTPVRPADVFGQLTTRRVVRSDPTSPTPLERPSGPSSATASVATSTAAATGAATGAEVAEIEAWGQRGLLQVFSGKGAEAAALGFVDQRLLAIVRGDARLTLVDAPTAKKAGDFRPSSLLALEAARFASDRVVTLSRVVSAGRECAELPQNRREACMFSTNDRIFFAIDRDAKLQGLLRVGEEDAWLASSADLSRLVLGTKSTVKVVELETGAVVRELPAPKGKSPLGAAISDDGAKLTLVAGAAVTIVDLLADVPPEAHKLPAAPAALSRDGRWAFVMPADGLAEIHALTYGTRVRKASGSEPLGASSRFGASFLLSLSSDATRLLPLEGGEDRRLPPANTAALAPDDSAFALVRRGALSVYDSEGRPLMDVPPPSSGATSIVAISFKGSYVARRVR